MADQIVTVNPATGEGDRPVRLDDRQDIESILDHVTTAQHAWADTGITTAPRCCASAAELLRKRAAELAAIATAEMGKPITESVAEVEKCAWVCEYYAETSPGVLADQEVQASGSRSWVRHEPLGTVLAIMPWNFPFWQVFRFAAPALMAGNAGLLKHSPNVTGRALAIEEHLPRRRAARRTSSAPSSSPSPTCRRPSTDLIQDDRIAAVTLTGSNRAGPTSPRSAGRAAKKSVLELGGSDPFVVLEDADLDVVVPKAVAGRFLNTGQSCLCAKRFIVHESIVEEFGRRFAAAVAELAIGDPTGRDDEDRPARPCRPRREPGPTGAGVRRGRRPGPHRRRTRSTGAPRWYAPTVLVDVTLDMPVMAEETFGPAAAVISFATDEEAVGAGQRHAVRARCQRLVRRRRTRPGRRRADQLRGPVHQRRSPPPTRACRSAASSSPATAASSARPAPPSSLTSARSSSAEQTRTEGDQHAEGHAATSGPTPRSVGATPAWS